jgi:hypothetical protein|mmetsp:Transcript_16054/g.28555  ORF Transcript_16054/g.28555 Transcript_16054/m.28555 type:complete len:118 (-) Transcript_16054:120-473(-)
MADSKQASERQVRLREQQWMYIGPIAAAPLAHVAVSSYRHAKTDFQRRLVLGVGVVGVTLASFAVRLSLMGHAGYPGGDIDKQVAAQRSKVMTEDERRHAEGPSMGTIIREAGRGFG